MPAQKSVNTTQKTSLLARLGTLATIISTLLSVAFFLLFAMILLPGLFSNWDNDSGNVAVIDVNGLITSGKASPFQSDIASSKQIIEFIEQADEDDDIKAIVLRIDSPGGTPVASSQVARAVKDAKKPVIAVIGETGASGAYWIASAADVIFADRLSITGSIGVIGSYLQFSGLLNKYNVTYERLVGGDMKDAGSPYKELTTEERAALERLIGTMHEEFIGSVATNRKMPREDVAAIANGFVYLGVEAQQLGLVDKIGGMDDAYKYINTTMGIEVVPVEYSTPPTLLDALMGVASQQSFSLGQGIGTAIMTTKTSSALPTLMT